MTENPSDPSVQLFYSYSHKDAQHRESLEKALALLKRDNLLRQWSDREILPGQQLSSKLVEKMGQANIVVFLLSPDFIASNECTKEWRDARTLALSGKPLFRIPIIVRDCAWKDMLDGDDVKALPMDGFSVASFEDQDTAWQQVYEGIKAVVNELRMTFTPKPDFLTEIDKSEFFSQHHLKLQDLFVFLRMTCVEPHGPDQPLRDTTISNKEELLATKHALIHAQDKAGKTALARHVYLSLVEESQPALLIDLAQSSGSLNTTFLRNAYSSQFDGDYSLWIQQGSKTLILDNMTAAPRLLDFVVLAKDIFERIVITLSSDVFYSFFKDEARLVDFKQMFIEPLTRNQQEKLIRKRLALSEKGQPITDGFIDQVESRVDSIIVSGKIVPRFPFYVLSILQTYEAYMPTNMSITSYGHCYYVLIVGNLMRSGISETDDDVNACFNFAERLAFEIHQQRSQHSDVPFDFYAFLTKYRQLFIIKDSIVNRLKHPAYGLINDTGTFRTEYMYYYFLGKFLASNHKDTKAVIESMCEASYKEANYLTLLFTIHHTRDESVIENILLGTMCTLDSVQPAILDREETRRFRNIVAELQKDVLTGDSVEQARGKVRDDQDDVESRLGETPLGVSEEDEENPVNGIYRILKNNRIMGQVLRNRHGNLEKSRIEEIVEIVADSGLRLVNLVLKDEEEIVSLAHYVHEQHPDWDVPRVKRALEFLSFIWTMNNVEQIVEAVRVPEIKEAVREVMKKRSTPAYDLIGYFNQLESAIQLTEIERKSLSDLLKKHDDVFVRRVLSIRTQYYMNTHRSKASVEQAICALLKVKYLARVVPAP